MRCQRVSVSMSVCWKACPMCSVPVTFGGGSWMQYAGVARVSPSGLWRTQPADSQRWYQRCSTAAGSKLLSSTLVRVGQGERARDRSGDRFAHHLRDAARQLGAHSFERLAEDLVEHAR